MYEFLLITRSALTRLGLIRSPVHAPQSRSELKAKTKLRQHAPLRLVREDAALLLAALGLHDTPRLGKGMGHVPLVLLRLRGVKKVTQRCGTTCSSCRLDSAALPGCGARPPCRFHPLVFRLLGWRQ